MSLLSHCRFCLKCGLSQSFSLLLTTGRVKEASLLFTQTCSFSTLEAQYHTVRYHYRTVRYQYRTVRYHIPYGISPYFFPWYFSLLFPHSFSCSGSLFLASSLSLGFTHGEVHNNSPPGITIRQTAISPPRWTFHPPSTRVSPLLLQQHPTPLTHLHAGTTSVQAPCIAPRQEFPVLRLLAPVMPVLPPPGALPVPTPPLLGPAPPPLCFNP